MGKRRSGRELAFRILFQCDVGGLPLDEVLATAHEQSEAAEEVWQFARALARGAWDAHGEADDIIQEYSAGWTLDRMPSADRNILRLAIYEMRAREDIPPSVSINEAIELAKRYSTQDSPKFVNGILGAFARQRAERA
jgi:N utilization substance protein B